MRRDRERTPERLPNGLLRHAPPLPPLLRGARRRWLAVLVLLGLGQAALGATSAWALVRMQAAPVGGSPLLLRALLLLVAVALAVGALKVHERVVAEKLGQDYVHQLRLTLVGDALTPGHSTSLGVTVARTTNDLSGVRNWVSQGIAPLVVAVPLICGGLATLAVLHPALALAMGLPLAVLGVLMLPWARTALIKTRQMRRTRGKLATRIADTVTASDGILAAGGTKRELRNLREASGDLVEIAVDRAETVGTIRAGGIVASTLTTLLVAATGTYLGLAPGVTMAAMAVAGLASTPVLELGRIVEYRQTYRAARMVLGPALAGAQARRERAERRRRASAELPAPRPGADGEVLVHLELPGLTAPGEPLRARSRDRIRLVSEDPDSPHELVRRLFELSPGPDSDEPDAVWVGGENLRQVSAKRARVLVGGASSGTVFERGTVRRALHYRRPDLDAAHDREVLALVGLDPGTLPEGMRTKLRSGGEPLGRADRARLALARAVYGAPPLLVIDGLEGDLDDAGRAMLERVLADYPGAVVMVSSQALAARLGAREHRLPRLDASARQPVGVGGRTAVDEDGDE
ncbi:ABC transporter transmembrane domain-containing protein [Brachybacterium sp. J153]|uniref:ABC transporter transmembrane domain-containing protein n=1 Tax=Brachybacterium sp. J153 TaxID=3116488 RepID=UPI002E75CB1C|nr:ABC transporter transmembrane domain-containing protein [Brachybacterium sp. J153]MEE1619511.1 ABC transporter transmembrane domain-containing protein [Brachybacterium sp. J153]